MAAAPRLFPLPVSAAVLALWREDDGYWTLTTREGAGLASAGAAEPVRYDRLTWAELLDVLAAVVDGWVPASSPPSGP